MPGTPLRCLVWPDMHPPHMMGRRAHNGTRTIMTSMSTKAELQRESYVRAAIHSNAMEGAIPGPEWMNDAREYIQGRIDTEEMRHRALARCGIAAAE